MQHTQFSQLKEAADDLAWINDPEYILDLFKTAITSDEYKNYSAGEIDEHFIAVQSIYYFLKGLSGLFGRDEKNIPVQFKSRKSFLDHKKKETITIQVITLLADLFKKVPGRKLVFDIQSVFDLALCNKEHWKDPRDLIAASFSLRILTQFIRDYEIMVSFCVEERICPDINDFTPVNSN